MAPTTKPILVTGATGYIASHIVEQLLAKGFKVRGTVRSLSNEESYAYLKKMPGAEKNLELVAANLNDEAGWEAAVAGCEIIMHTASPYVLDVKDPQADLVDPAVNGVKFVMEACLKSGIVKKVILTSSVAAIGDKFDPSKVYDEETWNESSSLTTNPYYFSKTQAEKYAHKFVKDNKNPFKLAVINPFATIGPSHRPTVNQSVNSLQRIMNGTDAALCDITIGYVDVRDVAAAHILAMERDVEGRFILCEGSYSWLDLANICSELYPDWPICKTVAPNWVVKFLVRFYAKGERDFVLSGLGGKARLNNARSKDVLGLEYRSMKATLKECVDDLIQQGHVKKPRKKFLGLI
eukprot:GDKH01020674.1.p1 GENE.GDKH01020674.1~~GDKH01020674.1.p1  ORF type:complete len:351 (+),score=69.56 GDKH01020674.1:127-1179(+)